MHVRTHTREHLYHCSQCHYSSITKNCLKRHVIQKHSNILLKCPTDGCDYNTPDKYKLQAHLKVHTELVSSTATPERGALRSVPGALSCFLQRRVSRRCASQSASPGFPAQGCSQRSHDGSGEQTASLCRFLSIREKLQKPAEQK